METPFGGLSINANTTPVIAPAVAAKYTQGWAAHAVSQHGEGSVVPSAAQGRLTLKPGVYEIDAVLVVETETVGGTSADAAGVVTFQFYKGGVAIPGALARIDTQAADRPQTVNVKEIVEVTQEQHDAGEGYVEIFASSGDASGNDILISNARFLAKRLN